MERDRRKEEREQRWLHRSIPLPGLRAARRRAALSQRQLAELAGVSANTVRLIESGRRGSYPSTVQKLASVLCVSPDELMLEDRPEREEHAGE